MKNLLSLLGHFTPGRFTELRVKDADAAGPDMLSRTYHTDPADLRDVADDWDTGHNHVWFGAAPRLRRAGRAEDVDTPRFLFVDIDPKDAPFHTNYHQTIASQLSVKPTATVHSGRGFQLYWLLSEAPEGWDALSQGWVRTVRTDLADLPVVVDKVFDRARMMRLPYTTNPKSGVVASIVDLTPSRVYDVGDFAITPVSEAPVETIAERIREGGRNPNLWGMFERLKWGGLTGGALRQAAHALNTALCDVPLPKQEVEGMVDRLNDPRAPQPISVRAGQRLVTESDVASAASEALAGEIMSVSHGGRTSWYAWSPSAGVWQPAPPEGSVRRWISAARDRLGAAGVGEEEGPNPVTLLNRCLQATKVRGIVHLMGADHQLPTYLTSDNLETDPLVLPVRNCYLDLQSGQPHEPDPTYRFTRRAEVDFDPSATCPTWLEFLNKLMPDPDEQAFLGRCFFLCLTGLNTSRAFVINTGTGRNGKSVAWGVLADILGGFAQPGDHRVITKNNAASSHDSHIANLAGLRLAVYEELSGEHELNGSQVKELTGTQRVRARAAYAPQSEDVRLTAKHVLITNHRPRLQGEDVAVGDRLRYIEWRVRLGDNEVKPTMQEDLLAERSGILNWILSHSEAFFEAPTLPMPERFAESARNYMEIENTYLGFVERYLAPCRHGSVGMKLVGDAWEDWTQTKVHGPGWAKLREALLAQLHAMPEFRHCEIIKEGRGVGVLKGVTIETRSGEIHGEKA